MTNLEIDRRLALAIGYEEKNMRAVCGDLFVRRNNSWSRFDHQDPGVIYPIAEKYKVMPRCIGGAWEVKRFAAPAMRVHHHSPRTCIALAVIEASEKGIL